MCMTSLTFMAPQIGLSPKFAKSHKISKSVVCYLKIVKHIKLRISFEAYHLHLNYPFKYFASTFDATIALNICRLLSVRKENQVHSLHFNGKFIPFASANFHTKLSKLIGHPLAGLTNRQINYDYP